MDNMEVVGKNKLRVDLTSGELLFIRAAALAWQYPKAIVDRVVKQVNEALELLDEDD